MASTYNATKQPKLHIEELLGHPTATMYGSKALHVDSQTSDYDIAYSKESSYILRLLMSTGLTPTDPSEYFKVGPESGYCAFFSKVPLIGSVEEPFARYADILVLHTDEDLDCIRSSINDLQSIPSYLLENKRTRIDLYQKALVHRGWKTLPPSMSVINDRGRSLRESIRPMQANVHAARADALVQGRLDDLTETMPTFNQVRMTWPETPPGNTRIDIQRIATSAITTDIFRW